MLSINEIKKLFESLPETALSNQGIFDGSAGMAIITGILYKQTQESFFKSIFQNHLNRISENIEMVKDNGFKNGLAGIGWSIEWLSQNKILEGINTDEILEDFDDLLYKTVVFTRNNDFTIINGNLGLFKYFYARCRSKNKGTHRYRKIVNQECLSILEDRVRQHLLSRDLEFNVKNIPALGDILKTISPLYNVLNIERESILCNALIASEHILIEHVKDKILSDLKHDEVLNLLYLSVNISFASINISNNHYQKVAGKFIDKIIIHLNTINSLLSQSELQKLSNIFILYCLHERGPKSVLNLKKALLDLKKKSAHPISLNDWKTCLLGHAVLNKTDFSCKIQDQIFYA